GLDVLVVGANIADMGKGEGDDLAGIGRIGEDLLIAGHRGIEADLADRMAGGAKAKALQQCAVGKDEQRGRFGIVPNVDTAMHSAMDFRPPRRRRVRKARPGHWLAAHVTGLLVAYYVSGRN